MAGRIGGWVAGCALFVSAGAVADDAGVLRCRAIDDSKARLACYDALAAPIPAPVTTATVVPSPAASAPMPRQTSEAFGLENRPTVEQLGEIQSHIPGKFEGWRPNSRITLANGQVWQISDGSTAYLNFSDPKVVIRRGVMGAFYMDVETDKRSPRVRRVQ